MPDPENIATARLDKWLWAARFFRTRSLAQQAIRGGKVAVQGVRAKPSRIVRLGECLKITRGDTVWEITIEGFSEKRGPATMASKLYAETPQSIGNRAAAELARKSKDRSVRPDKRQRRLINRWKEKEANMEPPDDE